jgi:Mn-dependent DtxR family transcriptional regulator
MTGEPQYLLAIYVAERDDDPPVSPGEVAAMLDRSPAATTEMFQRLESRGLVTHEPYEGATLTADGRDRAADLYGTYRVLNRFFRDVLDLDDHRAEARRLAGTISATVTDRLASTLLDDEDGPDGASAASPGSESW